MKNKEPDFQNEFELLGQKIVVKTEEESILAKNAIALAKKKVQEIRTKNPQLVSHQLAVLALLEVSGDLVRDRKKMNRYREELDQKCSDLLANLAQVNSA